MSDHPAFVYRVEIRAEAERIWQALTSPADSVHYYFGAAIESNWTVGDRYRYVNPDGGYDVSGEILDLDPPHRLVTTFEENWSGATIRSRVTWAIETRDGYCTVTLTHEGLSSDQIRAMELDAGWALICSGLKTHLEQLATVSP